MITTVTTVARTFAHRCLEGLDALHREEPWLDVARLFRIALLGWLFMHTALLLPHAASVWGPDAYLANAPFDPRSLYDGAFRLLDRPAVTPYFRGFLAAQLAALALGVAGVLPRLMTALAWFFTLNLNNRASITMDGGNNLSQLLLFYMMFMNTTGERRASSSGSPWGALATSLSNGAFWLSRLQVFAVYATAAVLKLNGPLWQRGMALYYILQSEHYSHPWAAAFVVAHPAVSVAATYFTVLFQISFPFLVWQRRTRPVILLAGTALHLGIAVVMGLFTFGTLMCVSYVVLFQPEWSAAVLRWRSPQRGAAAGVAAATVRRSIVA